MVLMGNKSNQPDEEGDTRLLKCLKLERSDRCIINVLKSGCDPNIPDKNGITPIYIALKNRRYYIANKLIEYGAYVYISCKIIRQYLEEKEWDAIFIFIRHNTDFVISFLDTLNIVKPRLSIYIDILVALVQLDRHLSKNRYKKNFNFVGENLIRYLLKNESSLVFRAIWPKLNHECISDCDITFLQNFFSNSSSSGSDFVLCFDDILSSCYVQDFFRFYEVYRNYESFFHDLLKACTIRNVTASDKLYLLFSCFNFIEVTILDVLYVYQLQGINQETLLLLKILKRLDVILNVSQHKCAFQFLKTLEDDHNIEQNVLNNLGMIAIQGYNIFQNWFDKVLYENIYLRESCRINTTVQTLFELSKRVAQIHIQNVFEVLNPNQFKYVVQSLCLPYVLKKALCRGVPVCYKCSNNNVTNNTFVID